jgi:IgA Peptidase M64
MPANGTIVNSPTIVDHGDPARRFDIVIFAEGFKQSQLGRFDDKAELLADRLLAMPPFDEVADLINVHTVRTASTDSGISAFPRPNVVKNTFYNVRGHFTIPGVPNPPASFMGTLTPQVILDAAETVAPLETLELFIVLVNVQAFAASAFPDQQLAFTGMHRTTADFVNYTAHECSHAIARTADEYLDCDEAIPGRVYLNQATEAQRLAGTVWWKSLAQPSELKSNGDFKAVHLFGDPNVHFTAGTHTPVFDDRPSLNGKLGLYWGCQDIDPTLPGDCDFWEDGRGRHLYRGMAKCKMRNVKFPFCRVCAFVLRQRIRAVAV